MIEGYIIMHPHGARMFGTEEDAVRQHKREFPGKTMEVWHCKQVRLLAPAENEPPEGTA